MIPIDLPWLGYGAALCGATLAGLSIVLPSRSLTRVTFGIAMGVLALETLLATASAQSISLTEAVAWQGLRLGVMCFVPTSWLLFSLTFARGNRREFLVRWWPVVAAIFVMMLVTLLSSRGQLLSSVQYTEDGMWFTLGVRGMWFHGLLLLSYVLILVNLERTLRAAMGLMRWRIKFIVVGLGVLFVFRIYTSSQKLLYHGWSGSLDYLCATALLTACFFIIWSVLRCGLGEADVYPSRAVIMGSITLTMTGLYLVLLGLLTKAVGALGWVQTLPLQALMILGGMAVLGLVFVSDRTRQRLETVLSRHFKRPAFDYRNIWQRFTERCASEIEETSFSGVAASFISEVFQTLSVTIWLVDRESKALRFGGSTILGEDEANQLLAAARLPAEAWVALDKQRDLVGIGQNAPSLPGSWQALCPSRFDEKGGKPFLLPLRSRERLVGILVLADRVGGREFGIEDRDLLRALGLEIAATLFNLALLQERFDAREADALRTMSSFFAHDLKNTGSTLALTLQNLRKHFGNPDFREDALRAIAKSVDHVNRIVEGLSSLQSELRLDTRHEDLNTLIRRVLKELDTALNVEVKLELDNVPSLRLDASQLKKVLVNLLLNARDAVPSDGQIVVRTENEHKWVSLSVKDNGCGMDPEFLRKRLFRPFQTTKRKGLGIGMFQSKMIVEAHGGRIEVESQVDAGTTCRVRLPVQEATH